MKRATRAALVKAAKRATREKRPLFVFTADRMGRPTRYVTTDNGLLDDPTWETIYVMVGLVYPEGTVSLAADDVPEWRRQRAADQWCGQD